LREGDYGLGFFVPGPAREDRLRDAVSALVRHPLDHEGVAVERPRVLVVVEVVASARAGALLVLEHQPIAIDAKRGGFEVFAVPGVDRQEGSVIRATGCVDPQDPLVSVCPSEFRCVVAGDVARLQRRGVGAHELVGRGTGALT